MDLGTALRALWGRDSEPFSLSVHEVSGPACRGKSGGRGCVFQKESSKLGFPL